MISDPVQDLTGDVLYDLYDFNGRQPGANIGYVRKNYTVTYNANLPNGASLISGVSLPDAQTVLTWGQIRGLSGRNEYNRDAQVSGKNEYYKFLGWATTRNATTAEYTPGQWLSVSSDTTLYAVWERNDKDVMYFVLMPGIDAPSNGADQGYQKYYPNKTDENDRNGDDGGVSGCTVYTGYTGGNLTATGFNAVPTEGDSVVDLAGQYSNSTYLSVPSNLGYFNANTETEKLNLDMTGKEIVWYVIKNQEDGYHVDGYVKNVPIKVRYHENFNGDTAVKDTVTGIVSGGTVIVKTAEAVFGEGYTHPGYTFAGWSTSQGEDGTVYQPGNQTEQLVTSLDLYAKWVKDNTSKKTLSYTVEYYKDNEKVASDTQIVTKDVWVNAPDTLTVDASKINTTNKYDGYKLNGTATGEIPSTIDNNGVIKVYYVKDEDQTKELKYTVEYYQDGVEVEADKQVEKQSVWAGAPNTLTVDASKINTTNKYDGYKLNSTATGEIPSTIDNDGVIKVYYVKDDSQTQTLNYTIIQHFRDGKGNPSKENPDITANKTTTNAQAALDSLITDNLKQSQTGKDGKTYVYVLGETKFTLNDKAVTTLVEGTEIHLYYYLDEVGGTPEKEGADRPDGIPDAWQHKVTFQVVNGNWNVSKNNKNIVVYVNAKNQAGEVLDSKLTASQIPAVGSEPNSGYNASGSWDKTLSDGLVINADTTFTFTYSKRSSSGGSSRPSTPTVTIPDDVPTGLNGKDHYAYIIGYGNNDVRPQNNITRAEVATIFFRLLTDETRTANMTKSNGYNDVKDGDWFCCAVSTLSKMGIIKGYEDGSFKPNDPISRAEFAAIAARFAPDGDKTPASFADVTSHWAKDEISIAANHGWIKGYEDGSFKPDQKITRAETMTLVNRVLNRLPETKDDLHKDMKTWVDNMDETAWYYLAVQEATNSHYFKNKTGTKFEQWTDLRDTRDWSELESEPQRGTLRTRRIPFE